VGAGVVAECRSALDGSHWSFRVTSPWRRSWA